LSTKSPNPPTDLEQFILTRMPHFIAIHYQRMLDGETLITRIEETLRTFELGLRALSSILVGQYVLRDLEKVHNDELNKFLVDRLPTTNLDVWQKILFQTLKVYENAPDLFFVSELYHFYWDTTGQTPRPRANIENPFKQLVMLHNQVYIERQTFRQKSEVELAEIARQALELLHEVLAEFHFMHKYEIIRILGETETGYLYERHTGLTIEQSSNPIATRKLHPGHFYLLNNEDRSTLALYPMVVFWQMQDIMLGLYQRLAPKRKRVEYSLPLPDYDKPHDDPDLFHDFIRQIIIPINLAQEQRRELFALDWRSLRKVTHAITDNQTETIREKYDANLYLSRYETRHTFDNFLASNKTCFVLVGQSGVGKSNFVLALTDEFREKRPEICVLVYNGATLESDQPLHQRLNKDLGRSFPGVKEGEVLAEMARVPEFSSGEGSLLVIIDAINENARAGDLLRQVDKLVRENEFPWLKIVLTSRPEAWLSSDN
jgi:hypothetical protein